MSEMISKAVDEVMGKIEAHELALPPTSQANSRDFYRELAERCATNADAIEEEMGEDGDDDDE